MKYFLTILLFIGTFPYHILAQKEEFEIPLTEDLMREHGILNRILLIYEEIIRRIKKDIDFQNYLHNTANILKSFIEDYHEKLEETYLFPIFEKHNKKTKLIRTLQNQHNKGREITAQLQQLSSKRSLHRKDKKHIKKMLKKFIRMYRPHEAREDTILFPQVRSLITKEEFKKLSDIFEDREHELFGKDGFKTTVKKVEHIEKQLGIYQLEQFTP